MRKSHRNTGKATSNGVKILFITLSNIGDCILTLPVLDLLIGKYPDAQIDVLCGPRAEEIFAKSLFIERTIIYDKQVSLKNKLHLAFKLRRHGYDLVIDLRHTVLPFLLGAKAGTKMFNPPKNILHAGKRHFARLKKYLPGPERKFTERHFFKKSKTALDKFGEYILIAAGARSMLKRWNTEGFISLLKRIINDCGLNAVLVGGNDDVEAVSEIATGLDKGVFNLAGKTDLTALSDIIRGGRLVVSCDSACLHLASYLNRPVIALFTATDPKKYGPWSDENITLAADIDCAPCEKAECVKGIPECINSISADAVYEAVKQILR